MSAPKAAT